MALDTRIALGVQPLQLADPLAREGQVQNILASQAQQRAAGMQQQSAQMQMDQTQRQLRQDEDYVRQMADAIGKNGGPPDLMQAFRIMATNRNPQISQHGVTGLQSLKRLDDAKKAGIYGTPAAPASEAAPAAAPVIPNAGPAPGALGSGTYGMDQNVPMFNQPNVPPLNLAKPTAAPAPAPAPAPVMNQLTPPAAAPVNQLGVTPKVDAIKALETRYATLAQFSDLPGVKEQMTLLGEQYKALLNQRNTAFAPIDASKYTPASLKAFNLSGDQSDLVAVTKAEKTIGTVSPADFTAASVAKFNTTGNYADLVAAPPKPGMVVNIDQKQEGAFATGLGAGQSKRILESQAGAQDAAEILRTNQVGRDLLKSGAITGTGADFLVGFNNALKQAGIDFGYADAAANSQAYAAALGSNVGRIIKQFGAGTGLSDADREYAAQIAGGKIALTEAALRKILDINDRAANRVIDVHNKNVGGIKTNIPLTVEKPTFAAPPPSGASLIPGSTPAAAAVVPQGAIDALKAGKGTDAQFDAIFGAGAAKRAKGGK
jgi:hypothetical protein